MTKLQEVLAIPLDEKFRRDSFVILSAKPRNTSNGEPARFSLLGTAEPGELKSHLPYTFWGRWDRSDNQYGPSFRFDSFVAAQPHGHAGIVRYLQQCRNVGPATAETLWEEFKGDAVTVLREQPARAAEAVGPRFSTAKATEAAEDLQKMHAVEQLTISLMDLFDGRGFGKASVKQALKLWGADALKIITRDPYRTMALRGVGFLKADRFYLDLGKPPQKLKRQAYCLTYAVAKESDTQGHVWVRQEQSVAYLRAAVAGADVTPEKALTLARRGRILQTKMDGDGIVWAADMRRANAEEYCCRKIVEAMATEGV